MNLAAGGRVRFHGLMPLEGSPRGEESTLLWLKLFRVQRRAVPGIWIGRNEQTNDVKDPRSYTTVAMQVRSHLNDKGGENLLTLNPVSTCGAEEVGLPTTDATSSDHLGRHAHRVHRPSSTRNFPDNSSEVAVFPASVHLAHRSHALKAKVCFVR